MTSLRVVIPLNCWSMIFSEDRWPPRIIGYAFSRSCSCARMTTPRAVPESGEMRGFYCKCEVILPHGLGSTRSMGGSLLDDNAAHVCCSRILTDEPDGNQFARFPWRACRLGRASGRGLHQKLARLPDSVGRPWGEDERYRSIIPKGLLGRPPSLSSGAAASAALPRPREP